MRFPAPCRCLLLATVVLFPSTALFAAPDDTRTVTWEKITREEPHPDLDVDAELARVQRDFARQGAKPDLPSFRRSLERDRVGSRQREEQVWSTDGAAVREDYSQGEITPLPQPPASPPAIKGYLLERDRLSVQVTTYSKPDAIRYAEVRHTTADTMVRTGEQGAALRSLLLGGSAEIFSRSPFVTEGNLAPEGMVLTLRKQGPLNPFGKPMWTSPPIRLTVSRDGNQLVRVEQLGRGDVQSRETTTAEGWDEVKTGLWLPDMVRVVSYDSSADGTRRVSRTETYRRVRVAVGKAVNVAPLREPFFSGKTSVRDYRFDGENPDAYSAERNPLGEGEARRRFGQKRRERALSALLPQLLGIAAIGGLIIGLLLKTRRGDE